MESIRGAVGRALILVVLLAQGAPPAWAEAATESGGGVPGPRDDLPVQIVVLVDQSGSLTPAAVEAEREAASRIAQSAIRPGTSVAVLGFASAPAEGQTSVDRICPLLKTDDEIGKQRLSECVRDIRGRTEREGDDTDFVEAFRTARDVFASSPDREAHRAVFLLTDGRLDVGDNAVYGDGTRAQRDARAEKALFEEVLPALKQDGVQVWPLGFGEADRVKLKEYAAAGAQDTCNANAPEPRAIVVGGPGEVHAAVDEAYESVLCQRAGPITKGTPPPGGQTDLYVDIPQVATTGSIEVVKKEPKIRVSYFDPDGRKVPDAGSQDESTFLRSGGDGPVEALRITDPKPGRWRVNLVAPEGVAEREVTARIVWQGRLDSMISADPPAPVPGSRVTVQVQLRTRVDVVDPAEFEGMVFAAEVSGRDLPATPIALNDEGKSPDRTAGDGRFTGGFAVPATAKGAFTVVGSVGGRGLVGDSSPYHGQISPTPPPVTGRFGVDSGEVTPGAALAGRLTLRNVSGTARTYTLRLAEVREDAGASVEPGRVKVPASSDVTVDVTLRFDERAVLGPVSGRIQAVAGKQDKPVAEGLFSGTLVEPPSLLERFWWLFGALLALLAAAVSTLVVLVRGRRRERDARGLTAVLSRNGATLHRLDCGGGWAATFRFSVRTGDGPPRLDRSHGGADGYVAWRTDGGTIMLRKPYGSPVELVPGRGEDIGDGYSLAVEDRRMSGGPGYGTSPGGPGGIHGDAPHPPPPGPPPSGASRPWGGDPLLD
ncbi:vWA domain-containing protein [Sinosporangium siamense]|uniref:VWFA domain-containing protein n=1 Tax=Sinosporangium siamense TaxID=1367973 RepID=A0A919R9U7_9ACTN|nr:vWA domain-containing protein [Sinosporangium siamense]GII90051.1 hypothetical protein Ssi02_02820 [Sinosporangium siamense]